MRSSQTFNALSDMKRNLELALDFTAGLSFLAFQSDRKTVYAVIRCLEILSEASRKLPAELKDRHPSIAWSSIVGAGNVYRHDYEDVGDLTVWRTIEDSLPPLRTVVEYELSRCGELGET